MKTKVSENPDFAISASSSFACDAALWIGPTNHSEMRPLWQICRDQCDTVAVRPSVHAAIQTPPSRPVSRVIIAQTNRHESATKALDHDSDLIDKLHTVFSTAKRLVIRGSLVAPMVQLPSTDANTNANWIESISHFEGERFLNHWLRDQPLARSASGPLTIVASTLDDADALMTSIAMITRRQNIAPPWMNWTRKLSQNRICGAGTILWDDSATPPATSNVWSQRIAKAPLSQHLWATGIANRIERQTAVDSGVACVIEKPGRIECLLSVLAVI